MNYNDHEAHLSAPIQPTRELAQKSASDALQAMLRQYTDQCELLRQNFAASLDSRGHR